MATSSARSGRVLVGRVPCHADRIASGKWQHVHVRRRMFVTGLGGRGGAPVPHRRRGPTPRRGPWLDRASSRRQTAVRRSALAAIVQPAWRQPAQRSRRPLDNEGIMPVLARAVREVENAVQRRSAMPGVRTQVPGRRPAGARGAQPGQGRHRDDRSQRNEQLKRLDGVATILAKTAARDPSLFTLLAEDAVLSDAAKALRKRDARRRRSRGRARGGHRGQPTPTPPLRSTSAGSSRSRSSRASSPTRSSPLTSPARGRKPQHPPPGDVGAARSALPVLRVRRRRCHVLHGAARAGRAAGRRPATS